MLEPPTVFDIIGNLFSIILNTGEERFQCLSIHSFALSTGESSPGTVGVDHNEKLTDSLRTSHDKS